MINALQVDINNNDYDLLSVKLNVPKEDLEHLNSIVASEIFRKNHLQEDVITQKFEIQLIVTNNEIIPLIQLGIEDYFNKNKYIKNCYEIYKSTLDQEIVEINNEINELKKIRNISELDFDMSSINIFSKKNAQEAQNAIIELVQLRSINITHLEVLKPLAYVQEFSLPNKTNKKYNLIFILKWAIVFFVFSLVFSVFQSVIRNDKKATI